MKRGAEGRGGRRRGKLTLKDLDCGKVCFGRFTGYSTRAAATSELDGANGLTPGYAMRGDSPSRVACFSAGAQTPGCVHSLQCVREKDASGSKCHPGHPSLYPDRHPNDLVS